MFGLNKDITLVDLFDKDRYERRVRDFETVVNGEVVMRKRHLFYPIPPKEPVQVVSVKRKRVTVPKKQDTFIPLFADLFKK
tara:strand:+ start:5386 stop:5628 length:243 start_codon:yes stop_codon:yes gene_type:complete